MQAFVIAVSQASNVSRHDSKGKMFESMYVCKYVSKIFRAVISYFGQQYSKIQQTARDNAGQHMNKTSSKPFENILFGRPEYNNNNLDDAYSRNVFYNILRLNNCY